MPKSWNDDQFRDKPEPARKRPRFVHGTEEEPEAMICDNCDLPVSLAVEPHCRCSIWDVGKRGR